MAHAFCIAMTNVVSFFVSAPICHKHTFENSKIMFITSLNFVHFVYNCNCCCVFFFLDFISFVIPVVLGYQQSI